MPEFTAPGLYQEERGRRLAPIQGVSTSNFGVVGMAERGPTDEAILCTSFAQFQEQFGGFIADSMLAVQTYAFFANEGRRAYVVRVTRSDALQASGDIEDDVSDELIVAACTGLEIAFQSVGAGGTEPDLSRVNVKPGSVTFRYWDSAAASPPVIAYTNPLPAAPLTGPRYLAVRLPNAPFRSSGAAIPAFLTWTANAVPQTARMDAVVAPGTRIAGISHTLPVPLGSMGWIDLDTGWMLLDFTIAVALRIDGATSLTATGHLIGVERVVTDDGAGNLVGDIGAPPNRIDYDGTAVWNLSGLAGVYEFSTTAAADRGIPVKVDYTHSDFPLQAKYKGAYGNDVSLILKGNDDSYDRDLGTFTKVNAEVWYDDPTEGLGLKEVFTGLVMDVPTDPNYIQTILADPYKGSSYLLVPAPGGDDNFPGGLNAFRVTGEIWGAGGNDPAAPASPNLVFGPLAVKSGEIQPYTMIMDVVVGGIAYQITDDGLGGLDDGGSGILDTTGTNTVVYTTGVVTATFLAPGPTASTILGGTPLWITVDYSVPPTRGDQQDEPMTGGTDGVVPLSRNEVSSPALRPFSRGVYALMAPDEMMNVGIPDFSGDVPVSLDLITWAEDVKDKFIILATPQGMTPQQAKDWKKFTLGSRSNYAALYWPWVGVQDPLLDVEVFYPPVGWVGGVYARTDVNRTVSKAPAGVDDGRLNFSISLEYKASQDEIGILNPVGVNALKDSEFTGRCVWGARTLGVDSDFRYIQARRFFMFVEKSIYRALWGFVFETIGTMLFERITRAVDGFLSGLLSQGYFPSGVKSESYAVICDTSNNTPSTIASGIVVCDIYLATSTPGEFLWFRYQQLVTA